MKTLHTALRVGDLEVPLVSYAALGHEQVGRVEPEAGTTLVMLTLPDDPAVTVELVHRRDEGPVDVGTGISHRAVQVDDLQVAATTLARAGLQPGPLLAPGGRGPRTCWLVDPDGYRIELVRWPPGHSDGMTAADFA